MEEKTTFRPYIIPTLILAAGGWGGLSLLLNFSYPTLWPRWSFYFLLIMASSGTAIPIVYLINKIYLPDKALLLKTVIRESVLIGIYPAILAWLNMGHVLDFTITVWLAVGIIVVEYLIRLRQSSSTSENVPPQSPIS